MGKIKYRLFDEEMCSFMSLASAFHYCASELKCGNKDLASWLANAATGLSKGRNARAQLDLLAKNVKEKSSYFRKYELRVNKPKVQE
jgi:hypothetical protein